MSQINNNTLANAKRVLSKEDLMAMAVGQIIGAGIMALTGVAIGFTGKGTSFAFLGAAIFTLCNAFPMILLRGTVHLRGGQYTQASILLGKTMSGVFAIVCLIGNLSVAMFALCFADYFRAIVPGVPKQLVALAILTLLVVMNLLGVKSASNPLFKKLWWRVWLGELQYLSDLALAKCNQITLHPAVGCRMVLLVS